MMMRLIYLPGSRKHVAGTGSIAGPIQAVAARTPALIGDLAESVAVLGAQTARGQDRRRCEANGHGPPPRHHGHHSTAPSPPSSSNVRGSWPACSYKKMITDQISSWVRKSSHAGMAEFHGAPSLGRPGPPFATRQKT